MQFVLSLYIALSLWALSTTALPSQDTPNYNVVVPRTVAIERALEEIQKRGLVDPKKARRALAEDPELLEMVEAGDTTTLSVRSNTDPGLARNLWVPVPATCYACIISCLTTATGAQYLAGSTVSTVGLWRTIANCGVTCVFSGECTTRQAGTWQAQQPHDFPTHMK